MSCGDDVEVVGRAVVFILFSTSQEFLVVHDPEICALDGVVGVKGVRDPMFAVVISTWCHLDFISYAVTLASLYSIGLDQRRRSSCVVSWVWSDIFLNIGSIGCIVDDVTNGIDRVVCWGISHRVGWNIGSGIGSWVVRLCYFVFTPTFFGHRVKGTLATTSLVRTHRSASEVATCCGSAVSGTSFFDLSSCNADIGFEASDH
jgi:hypothetical protein